MFARGDYGEGSGDSLSRLLFFRKPSHIKASLKIIDVASTILTKVELKKGVVLLHCLKCGDTTKHKRLNRDALYFFGWTYFEGVPYRREKAECLVCGSLYQMLRRSYLIAREEKSAKDES